MNYFKNIELFSILSETDQLNLSAFCQTQEIQSWEILFSQGDEPQAMYVITSWFAIVRKILDSGDSQDVAILSRWDLVWEIAFFWEPPTRNATVIAKDTLTVIVVIKFWMEQMMDKYPDLYARVKGIIQERRV